MNAKAIQVLAVAAATVMAAQAAKVGTTVSMETAERMAASLLPAEPNLSMWIWSDKYVYQPGEALTLRWTVKTNGDRYPYTVIAYRQNNQTGQKFYLPGGTEAVTDIFGNTLESGFQPTVLQGAEKSVLLGTGGLLGPAVTIPNELGMHTLTVELRDYVGGRVLASRYMKIGVVDGFDEITGNIEANRTLVNTRAYRLRGVVYVRNNAVLTIQPGTFVIGQPGSQPPSALIVTRNGRIDAAGTRARPIIMTSSRNFGERQRGDWGGLVMLGRASINVAGGEFNIEGLPANPDAVYGGTDPAHNCGTLRYVRVEYAGSLLSPNNELNSFTWGGCGTGTTAEYLQAIYGLDDSFEWFGGTSNARYLVGGLGADDYVDYQLGWTGKLQYGIFYQSPESRGNRGIEGDNSEFNNLATPFSNPTLYNLTFIGSGQPGFDEGNSPALYFRRGARGTVNNTVATNFSSTGLFFDGAATQAQVDSGDLRLNGVLLWNNGRGTNAPNTLAGQVDAAALTFAQGTRGQGRNFLVGDPNLRRPFEYSDPDFRGLFASPIYRAGWVSAPADGFFENARFIGGVGDDAWWEEWTSFLTDADIRP